MSSKPSKSKPNIRMVAAHVQLSPATVSLALRGSESIAPETRERVLAAARELNYIPAPRAERTHAAPTRHVLFMTKDFGDRPVTANPFYGEILSAAEGECVERGARLTFTLLPNSERGDEQLASIISTHKPDGIMLVGAYAAPVVRHAAELSKAPLVLVDNVVPGLPCDSVMADDFGGAQLSTRHLIDLGHREIAAVISDIGSPSFDARYRGYSVACAEAGISVAPPTEAVWERPALRMALEQVLARQPRPTAIFCVADFYAVFVMELLRDFGLKVPDDVSVVGFDNFPIARMAHPPLTTLQNHPQALGRLAARRLMARINGDDEPHLNITVTTQLIVRESTRRI
jgi:DNA-binding LacI/PurR family transcriptional regulator